MCKVLQFTHTEALGVSVNHSFTKCTYCTEFKVARQERSQLLSILQSGEVREPGVAMKEAYLGFFQQAESGTEAKLQ